MAIRTSLNRSPHAVISAVQQWDGSIGVGIVLRARGGVSVQKLGYVSEASSIEEGLYRALVEALDYASDHNMRGLIVFVDDAHVVDELTWQSEVCEDLRPWFVQVRCRANALWPARFEAAPPTLSFSARQLAQDALEHGQTFTLAHGTPILPLRFAEDLVA